MMRLVILTCAFLVPLLIARQGRDYKMFAAETTASALLFLLLSGFSGINRLQFKSLRQFAAPVAWIACLLIARIHSIHASATEELTHQLVYFSFLPLAAIFLGRKDINRLTWILWGAFLFVGGYAVIQHFGLEPVEDFRKWNPQDRVFSTFGNPDFLGAFTAFLLPLFIGRIRPGKSRGAWIGASLLDALVLYWTYSRGAWLGASAGMLVWFLAVHGPKNARRLLPRIILGGAVISLVLSLTGLLPWSTFTRRTDRVQLWKGTLAMISDKPVTGWGLGSFSAEFPPYAPPEFAERMKADNTFAEHPHCEYLHIAEECGILGLGVFFWLLVWLASVIISGLRVNGSVNMAGPLGALAAIVVHILVDRNFRLASTAVPFWIMAGALLALRPLGAVETPASYRQYRWSLPRTLLAVSSCILVVLAAYRPLSASLRVGRDRDFLELKSDIPLATLELQRPVKSGDPAWQVLIGNAYAQEKQFDRASKSFAEALRLDPRNVSAANNLGNSYFMMSRFDEAIKAYERALEIDPGHKDARFNMAYAWFHKRDIKKALIECDKLLRMDPTYFKAVQLKSQLAP